ncbi:ComF family protein [Pseudooceanicola onchidii]|uniref:ComF family protein n=1 Tax=Pseudooceanicola onchidii TaxID=2562279 RepID=UPI0010AB4693|nr:ComF family protein [Pseudooceanicola onchidii]
MRAAAILQTGLRLIYPPTCLTCDALVSVDHGLCGACWRDTPFVGAPVCQTCGAPLLADHAEEGELCDDCLRLPRPWQAGRTALIYRGTGRKLVLGLKHGDRLDIAGPAAVWMAGAARDIVQPGMLVAPIPLHWRRRIKRRYNQSVLLGRGVARHLGLAFCPDLLLRPAKTPVLDGMTVQDRFDTMAMALTLNTARAGRMRDRPVMLIDDVMTSGATLSAATGVLLQGGAQTVSVLTLARAVKET